MRLDHSLSVCLVAMFLTMSSFSAQAATSDVAVAKEFIYETAPFPECHASTIAQTTDGTLVAAWFGGKHEKNPDVGIWFARKQGGKWTTPVEVVNGVQSPGKRYPCWNPVLFQPRTGPLYLFFKVGPSPRTWWGEVVSSEDAGRTWRDRRKLPNGGIGPVKNKPIQLADGTVLCGSSTEHAGWRVHFERTSDLGKTWSSTEPINDGRSIGAIQPSILVHPLGRLQALGRSRQGQVWQSWSEDQGKSWSKMELTKLPNPNSGTDAVTLVDGRHVLVYNPTKRGRSPLVVAISKDGEDWKQVVVLEDQKGEFSYPAIIQTTDGKIHITYTWKRQRVRHAVLDPGTISLPGTRQ